MADKNDGANITQLTGGLHTDNSPLEQPKGTYRFALNAIEETIDGNQRKLSNEFSNYDVTAITTNYYPIGDVYIGDNTILIISVNPTTNVEEIGILTKAGKYTVQVNTKVLGLSINNQCDIEFRLRRGNERVIYWVDGNKNARTYNIDKPYNFYNVAYSDYLKAGGNPVSYVGEKWDVSSFELIKSYSSIPTFNNIEIIENGNILSGSYNFAIQYIDADLNPTEWITTSNTVNIFVDSLSNVYGDIRGSRNVVSDAQRFSRANKSIKLTIGNLDTNFPYYRVAVIQANGNSGEPTKVLVSNLSTTSESIFTYNGNDTSLTEINIGDILIAREVILSPKHIEQIENRLILANTKGKNIDLCEFQKYASKINSDLVTKNVILNNAQSDTNIKNAKSTFTFHGYMPGEVESFGIVYVFPDFLTPAYHIPGKNISNTTSLMKYHELNSNYLEIHSCGGNNYWGVDSTGSTLLGKRIRHHRFPYRHEVNKPLITRNSNVNNITKYRLSIVISLNPSYTPSPAYPVDGNNIPLVLSYLLNYQATGAAGTSNYSNQLTETDVANGVSIIVYDDTLPLDILSGTDHYTLSLTSELGTYQTPGNNLFIITETYESYIASSSIDNDEAEIFGIKFSNIEKPHPDCIGCYIVRNEKTDEDKIVIDNALFGPMTQSGDYRAFGLLSPTQYYITNNCGTTGYPSKTVDYYKKGAWFFSPEHQFFNKKVDFDNVIIQGSYAETTRNMPSTCNSGKSKGVYINDVQAGTSYNPDINKKKDKDDDGFDLLIGYRNLNMIFSLNSTNLVFPTKTKTALYMNAASYNNFENKTYYNVSVDNKIGMFIGDGVSDMSTSTFNKLYNTTTNKNGLIYGALTKNNNSSYSNFLNRNYYKEHNNPILFGTQTLLNNIQIYNGDASISGTNIVSSIYYAMVLAHRSKKSGLWKIITGAVLLVAAVVLTIVTAGAGTPLAIAIGTGGLGALAISYGVSLAMSGIKFEQFKSMIEDDYEKGLLDTVSDGGVFETIRGDIEGDDDTIRWFADRISNVYIESYVPFGLRSGLTSGVSDFTNAPKPYEEQSFRSYLTEKLTAIDRDQGSGRSYKGYATAEVYDMNKDYMRKNRETIFIHLPVEYDCCSKIEDREAYPMRRWYSEQSFQEELTDNYRTFLPNSYSDIEGEHGEITDLFRFGNNLFVQSREALWQQPTNIQERVTGEIVSFIGTGEYLSLPPKKILDDKLGSAGSQHKWATLKTPYGVFFISEIESKPYLLGETPKDISEGNSSYFAENIQSFLSQQLYDKYDIEFKLGNNPSNPNGIGYTSVYDARYYRLIFTKRDYLILPNQLAVMVIKTTKPTQGLDFSYCLEDGRFYKGTMLLSLSDSIYFEDKSFTMSFSFKSRKWVSWHSYIPLYYFQSQESIFSFNGATSKIWKHHKEGNLQTFYGKYNPFMIEYIVNSNVLTNTILNDIVLQTMARKWDATNKQFFEDRFITFNKLIISNNTQCTGELVMIVKDTQTAPQNWYQQQITNVSNNSILITKKQGNWNINDFRNYVDDYTKPIFTRDWSKIKTNYFIDKVVNSEVINLNKNWHELESFTDKFVSIRLKFDTFDNVNLIVNYSIEFEQPSNR